MLYVAPRRARNCLGVLLWTVHQRRALTEAPRQVQISEILESELEFESNMCTSR